MTSEVVTKLIDQHRTGVLPEHRGRKFGGGRLDRCRLTVPAREVLATAGAHIDPDEPPMQMQPDGSWLPATGEFWRVQIMQRCPTGLVVEQPPTGGMLLLRTLDEPKWPVPTMPADEWTRLDLTPCPTCGSSLMWYEAGYVPGYRVCAGREHHHWQLDLRG